MGVRKKPRMVSMRMTEKQYQSLEAMIKDIQAETGTRVSKSSLILKLIEYGKPMLKGKYPNAFMEDSRPEVEIKELDIEDDTSPGSEAKGFWSLFR